MSKSAFVCTACEELSCALPRSRSRMYGRAMAMVARACPARRRRRPRPATCSRLRLAVAVLAGPWVRGGVRFECDLPCTALYRALDPLMARIAVSQRLAASFRRSACRPCLRAQQGLTSTRGRACMPCLCAVKRSILPDASGTTHDLITAAANNCLVWQTLCHAVALSRHVVSRACACRHCSDPASRGVS